MDLDFLSFEECSYIKGYFDCLLDSGFDIKLVNLFYRKLESLLK